MNEIFNSLEKIAWSASRNGVEFLNMVYSLAGKNIVQADAKYNSGRETFTESEINLARSLEAQGLKQDVIKTDP